MTQTTVTHATWTAPSTGTYYATVIAYNHALEPSIPICTDGVTIDKNPPNVSQVRVHNSRIRGALINDTRNQIWIVNKDLKYMLLLDASKNCK